MSRTECLDTTYYHGNFRWARANGGAGPAGAKDSRIVVDDDGNQSIFTLHAKVLLTADADVHVPTSPRAGTFIVEIVPGWHFESSALYGELITCIEMLELRCQSNDDGARRTMIRNGRIVAGMLTVDEMVSLLSVDDLA